MFGHQYGDPDHARTSTSARSRRPPFYAIAVVPTPLGTALGLRTNPPARVLDEAGAPIPGLYACGNDANSVMASEYPGAGCQVGAALTFGHLAARHAAANHDARTTRRLVNPYPTLSGETLVVPIIGDPIAQVKSPDGITRTFAARGCNAVVVPLQVTPADFDALITG